jgi:hypothetical protein
MIDGRGVDTCYFGQIFVGLNSCDIKTISATWLYFPWNVIMARYHELILIFCIRKDEDMMR